MTSIRLNLMFCRSHFTELAVGFRVDSMAPVGNVEKALGVSGQSFRYWYPSFDHPFACGQSVMRRMSAPYGYVILFCNATYDPDENTSEAKDYWALVLVPYDDGFRKHYVYVRRSPERAVDCGQNLALDALAFVFGSGWCDAYIGEYPYTSDTSRHYSKKPPQRIRALLGKVVVEISRNFGQGPAFFTLPHERKPGIRKRS